VIAEFLVIDETWSTNKNLHPSLEGPCSKLQCYIRRQRAKFADCRSNGITVHRRPKKSWAIKSRLKVGERTWPTVEKLFPPQTYHHAKPGGSHSANGTAI